MKNLQRFLCAVLCILLCITMVLPAAASSSSARTVNNEKTQIKDPIGSTKGGYTRIVFTDANNSVFRQTGADGNHTIVSKSDANLANSKYPYALASMHTSAGNIGKDYPSFVVHNGVECIKPAAALDISYGGKYGFAFNVNTKHQDYKKTNRNYAVITYATEAEDTIELRLTWGNPDMTNRQIGGTYTTETGKWQAVSFPLSGAWKDGREKLGIYSNDEFYIRELVFFESKDDAEKYALRAGAYFNGEDYSEIKAMYNDPINAVTAKSIRYTFTEDNITDSGFATIKDHGNGLETKENPQNVFTFNDGRVPYVNAKGVPRGAPANSGRNKWGMSIVFNGLGKSLTKNDDVYIVTTYRSDSENDHAIGFYPITYDKLVDVAKVAKNTEGWCASTPFRMGSQVSIASGTYKGQTMFERVAAREVILYTSAEDVDGLNIREVVFIADKSQAQAYAFAATEYYNAIENNIDPNTIVNEEKPDNSAIKKFLVLLIGRSIGKNDLNEDNPGSVKDPIMEFKSGYTRITFTDAKNKTLLEDAGNGNYKIVSKPDANLANTKYTYSADSMHGSAENIGKDYPAFDVYKGVECIKPAKALVNSNGGDYGFAFTINANHVNYDPSNRNYAVITYATEAKDTIEFRLTWGYSISPAVHRQIGGTYTTENGKWESVSFQLTGPWKDGREKLGIYSNDEFYIRELVFFKNKADADAYAAKAGAYFNGEEYSELENVLVDPINSVTAKSIRYTFVEGNIASSGFATVKSHGNGLEPGGSNATNNVFTYYNDAVSYVNAKGVPRGAPAGSGKNKWGMSVVFNNLKNSLSNNDDVYIVTTYLSESENDHVIGIYTISHDKHVVLANVAKNTKGWCASAPVRAKDQVAASNGDSFFTKLSAREAVIYTSATDVDGLNIREVVFIADKTQAQAYAAAATAYYNAIENYVP